MKKIRYVLTALVAVLMAGCFDINEEIVINANGSGSYVTRTDMGAMVEMMQTMGVEEELAGKGLDKVIDTTIALKSVLDSSKDATAEQKRLLKDASMKFKMNIKEKIMKADVNIPFRNYADLGTLMSGSGTGGLGDILKKVMSADTTQKDAPAQSQGLDDVNSIFDVKVANGSITKTLNKERYDKLMEKPEISQARQLMGSGFEILYTTSIKLPRPVKKSDNALLKLSPDKKTVTMKYNLVELLDQPDKFSYSISF